MTLHIAKSRRLVALRTRNQDRVLVTPARHGSDVALPEEGTVAAYLIDALGQGSTVEQIQCETGWSKATAMVNLYKVAKKSGVGIQRKENELHLILPEGAKNIYPRQKVIYSGRSRGFEATGPVITRLVHT
jgi:hypothetical protein